MVGKLYTTHMKNTKQEEQFLDFSYEKIQISYEKRQMAFKMKNPLPVLKAVLEVYVKSSLSQAFFVLKLMVQDISSAQQSLFCDKSS